MAKPSIKSSLTFNAVISIELTEAEADALNEMTKYGIKSFLDGYEKQLGSHYIRPHREGLASLFKTIDESLPRELKLLRDYKEAISEAGKLLESRKQ